MNSPALHLQGHHRRRTTPVLVWLGIAAGAAILCGSAVAAGAYAYRDAYAGRVFPGVVAFGRDLGGLTPTEAHAWITERVRGQTPSVFSFRLDGSSLSVPLRPGSVAYDTIETSEQAMRLGRTGSFVQNALVQMELRIRPRQLNASARVDETVMADALRTALAEKTGQAKDAAFEITWSKNDGQKPEPLIRIVPEQMGLSVDVDLAVRDAADRIRRLSFEAVPLSVTRLEPAIVSEDLEPLIPMYVERLRRAPFFLTAESGTWTVSRHMLADWTIPVRATDGKMSLEFDESRLAETVHGWLDDTVRSATTGTFRVSASGTRALEIILPKDGVYVDLAATKRRIETAWANGSSTIALALETSPGLFVGDDPEWLGVRQSIGSGRSNFAGSPVNRRKNITLGAEKLHGILIPPAETFSLLKALGEIDGEHGWLPELVIKGDKTTPEFGGGLCQVGTTIFRATMGAALPVVERRNHSYRVRYYEPAGTDATIYDPAPDYRFKNDTGKTLLLTTVVKKDQLVFTFWGTPDGRVAAQTTPRIFNIVPPPEKKIIETLDLPPGATKCTEVAHAGADATFDYLVTYPNGEQKKTTFNSHYRPWGAVCLLGVSRLSASSTTEIIDETGINNPN